MTVKPTFTKAVRKRARLRLGITGPSGSGKTFSGLLICKGLGGRTAVIDTEHGSASLYSHLFDFDVLELAAPYSPERYIEAMKAAEEAGYDNLLVDSITHEWSGIGGVLALNQQIAESRFKGNTWSAWNVMTPRHDKFMDSITQSPMHIVATMRSKTETAQEEVNGRKVVRKLGMKNEQREGAEYNFTLIFELVHDGHWALAAKDRTGLFAGTDPHIISEETGKKLLAWLNSGAEPAQAEQVAKDAVVWQEWAKKFLADYKAAADISVAEMDRVYEAEKAKHEELKGVSEKLYAFVMESGAKIAEEAAKKREQQNQQQTNGEQNG